MGLKLPIVEKCERSNKESKLKLTSMSRTDLSELGSVKQAPFSSHRSATTIGIGCFNYQMAECDKRDPSSFSEQPIPKTYFLIFCGRPKWWLTRWCPKFEMYPRLSSLKLN